MQPLRMELTIFGNKSEERTFLSINYPPHIHTTIILIVDTNLQSLYKTQTLSFES
jgi:hypothetical protein